MSKEPTQFPENDDPDRSCFIHASAKPDCRNCQKSLAEQFESVDDTDDEDVESAVRVEVVVEGAELNDTMVNVIDTYAENIETFIRKNSDYGSSFTNSAKIESVLKHGEIREDELPELVARQIFVRGMLDKMSRFYQLAFEQERGLVGDEALDDTLLDLGNYSIMLAAQLRAAGDDD